MHDDADMMIRLIAETIGQVPPNPLKHWNQRIVLGCWAVSCAFPPSLRWSNLPDPADP